MYESHHPDLNWGSFDYKSKTLTTAPWWHFSRDDISRLNSIF